MSSTKIIDIFNNLSFVNDFNANGLTSGSNLVTINSYGILSLKSTQDSFNNTTGAIVVSGGVAINAGVNSTAIDNGGTLTVGGGGAFSQDVYIGGNLNISGTIISNASVQGSNSFNYLTLTATDNSINLSTGSLVTNGGISIQAAGNATSTTSGGGITIAGGAAIRKDIYVGGTANLPNIVSTNITASNVRFSNITSSTLNVNFITSANALITSGIVTNLLVTNSLNAIFNSNTIGSIFTTGGNVGINTTTPGYLLDINGNLRVNSNSLNIISASTLTDVLQIQNTSASGASTLQFLNNSGSSRASFGVGNSNAGQFQNTVFLSSILGIPIQLSAGGNTSFPVIINASDNSLSITSTTVSNSVSSGALKVSGGVGINGNLYVGGGVYVNSQLAATITNTTVSSNSTTGAVLLSGGLSINILSTSNANATSYTSGGALTINGGAAISQNVYISGIIDIASGSNNLNNISLQSFQFYSNSGSGTYSVIGSGNASRTATSFTPIRFTGWNDQTNPKLTINTNTIDIFNAINATNNTNTIGNIFTTGGNVGIGLVTPNAQLQFSNTIVNRKIVLYDSANNNNQYFGFGINSLTLRYQVDNTDADHVFFAGVNSTISNELFRIKGTGNIIVAGTTNSVSLSTGNLFSNNISTGTINSTGLTTGNINFTGNLFQNGVSYVASQWNGSVGSNLSYTSGNVIINNLTTGNLNFTGTLSQNGSPYIGSQWTNTSGSAISYTSGNVLITNANITNSSITTLNAGNLTTGNINFTGSLFQNGTPYIGSQWTNVNSNTIYFGTTSNAIVSIGTTNQSYALNVAGIISGTGLAIPGTTNSLNSTTGQYIFNSVSISSTAQNTSFTQGGALTVNGGVGVGGSIAVGGSVNYGGAASDLGGSFAASNNISTATDITGLIFPSANYRSFVLNISIQITATSSLNAIYTISGIQTSSGWVISDSYDGDDTGIFFSIVSGTGQMLYTSTNQTGWILTNLVYKATVFSISANYIPTALGNSGNSIITGSLSVGGSIINNNVDINASGTFTAVNGQTVPANITSLLLTSSIYSSFSIIMNVSLLRSAGGNLKAQYTIEGIQQDSGWFIYVTSLGDTIDLTFNILSTGQLQYSSTTSYVNFTSLTFYYNLRAFYASGAATPLILPSGTSTAFSINSTNDITSVGGAALQIAGGVTIAKNLLVGSNITAANINTGAFIQGNSKKYIYSGTIANTTNGNIILSFNTLNSYLYAKVAVALQETSNLQNISVLQFECSAAGNTVSAVPNFWNLGISGSSGFPWFTGITTGSSSTAATLQFAPVTSLRNYTYTIHIDLIGTASAAILSQDNTTVNTWVY